MAINVAAIVDRALKAAGIPIDGVSIGNPADRATWSVAFSVGATPTQQTAAATLLTTVAVDAAAQKVEDQAEAQGQIDALSITQKAIVLALIDEINLLRAALSLTPRTPVQAVAAIRTKAGLL